MTDTLNGWKPKPKCNCTFVNGSHDMWCRRYASPKASPVEPQPRPEEFAPEFAKITEASEAKKTIPLTQPLEWAAPKVTPYRINIAQQQLQRLYQDLPRDCFVKDEPKVTPAMRAESFAKTGAYLSDAETGGKVKSDGGSTSYYQLPKGATELNDLIEEKAMSFALGNIFKACYRLGEKHGSSALYDINKIIFFAERMKARIERETKSIV